eukprot:CAMPEP_0185574734 /NCGR_PEP_ID=MMETSP0434-20130131/6118_1 /TAXON_ID=626734 ORGANISM="Favella taraikaensis, Strain Fe Narragansett Bay" /NCGR_SAMPLE_ID=MMETSP0434 /ASSEMBLY_ACC=CAM_ASM_000379 /LENGTH=131 /DNA_ID=CAMNT_0028191391 /DNA_START=210 /DNA_END=605 /DNA_ORIENTATION=+
MAFSLENYLTTESLTDPRYVKWFAIYSVVNKGVWHRRELPIYPCTDKDYQKFYPLDDQSKSRFDVMNKRIDQQLFCTDWENSGVDIYGLEATGNFAAVDIMAAPCNLKLTQEDLGGLEDRIDDECVWDLNA